MFNMQQICHYVQKNDPIQNNINQLTYINRVLFEEAHMHTHDMDKKSHWQAIIGVWDHRLGTCGVVVQCG